MAWCIPEEASSGVCYGCNSATKGILRLIVIYFKYSCNIYKLILYNIYIYWFLKDDREYLEPNATTTFGSNALGKKKVFWYL